jgi:16S rRNA (guanine966-N2)-methyltransferase
MVPSGIIIKGTTNMNLRIIAGKFGGRIIQAPTGKITHPMSERVRSSLFNMILDKLPNAKILDAFAGSGSLGLEALSRGAAHATFIERGREAGDILSRNIKELGVESISESFKMNVNSWITKNQDKMYDVIFTDPPYNDMQFSTVSRLSKLLSPNGIMVISYPGRGEVPTVDGIVVVDNRSYGTAALAFYHKIAA